MKRVLEALHRHAIRTPDAIAVEDGTECLTYARLAEEVERLAAKLKLRAPRVVGLLADNGAGWVLTDLAAMSAGIPIVPLPMFVSDQQLAYVIRTVGIDFVVTGQHERVCSALPQDPRVTLASFARNLFGIGVTAYEPVAELPDRCAKITFTSGTTGEPKGVCLARAMLENTATALCAASAASAADRHLCVTPLATLLENVAGVYAPLLAGATICAPPLAAVGLRGSSSLDAAQLARALSDWRATSAIVVPQMLAGLVSALHAGLPFPRDLAYLAVGGAAISTRLLDDANALRLPVRQGYGLSECGSVVCVNRHDVRNARGAGRPLPHVGITLAGDGEILVRGSVALGYFGGARFAEPFATGDIGCIDPDGNLHVTGRKRNVFITSFGRNVAPEWIESELLAHPAIAQAAVFGEGRPFACAVIAPRAGASDAHVAAAVDEANRQLPDYARIRAWCRATEPFSPANAQCTDNGRLRRAAIEQAYIHEIDALYEPTPASYA
jgi:long-subunit acyl-CoA synthetase (AMP-forming)